MSKTNNILVSICCITFNHASFIRDCIEGFLMQKTNFNFEILIHDDASTDGTEQIIREYEAKYPTLIKPLYENENQWNIGRRGNKVFNYPRAKGVYIALCEGDDYWTDPYKLQKQVDFLEGNQDYGLSCTDADVFYEAFQLFRYAINKNNKRISNRFIKEVTPEDILAGKFVVRTASVVLRRSLYHTYLKSEFYKLINGKVLMGDTPMWVFCSMKSRIHYLDEVTMVYRVNSQSVSKQVNIKKNKCFYISTLDLRLFCIKYNLYDFTGEFKNSILRAYNKSIYKYMFVDRDYTPLFPDALTSKTKKRVRRIDNSTLYYLIGRIGVKIEYFILRQIVNLYRYLVCLTNKR